MIGTEWRTFRVQKESSGLRLDRALATQLPDFTRNRLQALVREGCASVAGAIVVEPSRRVNAGDLIYLSIPVPALPRPKAEEIPLDILYEDDDLIVINKPAGMVVHPAPGHMHGTLVNALIHHCHMSLSGIGGERRPGIVHRLDKDTTGLLVAAKNDLAHQGLSDQFAAHGRDGRLKRTYDALVWNRPRWPQGRVDAPIGRAPANRLKQTVSRRGGRDAVTRFSTMKSFLDRYGAPIAALLSCQLETGRTHQIRVHMAYIGHPLLCDPLYAKGFESKAKRLSRAAGTAVRRFHRQALHTSHLGFLHPRYGNRLEFQCSPPNDLQSLIEVMSL